MMDGHTKELIIIFLTGPMFRGWMGKTIFSVFFRIRDNPTVLKNIRAKGCSAQVWLLPYFRASWSQCCLLWSLGLDDECKRTKLKRYCSLEDFITTWDAPLIVHDKGSEAL